MRRLCILALGVCLSMVVYAQSPTSTSGDSSAKSATPPKLDRKSMRPPVPLNSPEAEFPKDAPNNLSGLCLVYLIVDTKGMPRDPQLKGCSDPIFNGNALGAAMNFRFKPARTHAGDPIEVGVTIEVNFRRGNRWIPPPAHRERAVLIRTQFFPPPGPHSSEADAQGIYPLSNALQPPKIVSLESKGLASKLHPFSMGAACHAVLVIDTKGKASEVQILDCDKPEIEKSAADCLLHSKYTPATLNGIPVSVRATLNLVYDGFGPQRELTGVQ